MLISPRKARINFFALTFQLSGWALVAPSCFALQVPYVRGSMLQRDVLSSEGGGGGGGLNRWSTCSRWWTAGTSYSGCLFTTDTRFLSVLDHHLTDYHQNQTHGYSCCIRIPSVTAMCSGNNNYINLSECLLPGPRTELPGPVPGQARVWLRHCRETQQLLQTSEKVLKHRIVELEYNLEGCGPFHFIMPNFTQLTQGQQH